MLTSIAAMLTVISPVITDVVREPAHRTAATLGIHPGPSALQTSAVYLVQADAGPRAQEAQPLSLPASQVRVACALNEAELNLLIRMSLLIKK